jgi:hypothetical protein
LLARYPELGTRGAGRSIGAAPVGARSGLLPAPGDSGYYLVVLITEAHESARVDTVHAVPDSRSTHDCADAAAHRILAAHIENMATRKPSNGPVAPIRGQLPLFTLPGQRPEPTPPAANTDRPNAGARRPGTAA